MKKSEISKVVETHSTQLMELKQERANIHLRITNQDASIKRIEKQGKRQSKALKKHTKEEMKAHANTSDALSKINKSIDDKVGKAMGEIKALKVNDRWVNGALFLILGSLAYFK